MRMNRLDIAGQPLEGACLIEANAGTGKTYAIQHLYLRLLLERELRAGEILVVTFTDLATAELRNRVRDIVAKAVAKLEGSAPREEGASSDLDRILEGHSSDGSLARLRLALLEFDDASISTIHGFCKRTLSESAFESGMPFQAEFSEEADEILERFVKDFWRRKTYGPDGALAASILAHAGFGVDDLLSFAKAVYGSGKALLPERSSYDAGALGASLEELKLAWRQSGAEAVKLVLSCKDLSRGPFKDEPVKEAAASLDAFASARDGVVPWEALEFFSKGNMDSGITDKKKEEGVKAPDHRVFSLCEEASAQCSECSKAFKLELAGLLSGGSLRKLKGEAGVMSFDDLLIDLEHALAEERLRGESPLRDQLRTRYKAVLIDEFQDTDPVQYRIFKTAFLDGAEAPSVFLIGDPKQSIYAFRNADVFSYMDVRSKIDCLLTLRDNYRSTEPMIEAVNKVFLKDVRRPFVIGEGWLEYSPSSYVPPKPPKFKDILLVKGEPVSPPLRFVFLEAAQARPWECSSQKGRPLLKSPAARRLVAEDVAGRVAGLLALGLSGEACLAGGGKSRPLVAGDVAVLVSDHRQAGLVRELLRGRGVPAVVQKSLDVFESPEAEELAKVLEAVSEPASHPKLKAALCSVFFDVDPRLLDSYDASAEALAFYEAWLEYFQLLRRQWERGGFMRLFSTLLELSPAKLLAKSGSRSLDALPAGMELAPETRVIALSGGERRISNLRLLAERLLAAPSFLRLDVEGQSSMLLKLMKDQERSAERECRLESDESSVKIMTVFKSKGLEFPVVFAPFLWSRELRLSREQGSQPGVPFHDDEGRLLLDIGSDGLHESRLRRDRESLAELVRLAYVALTRASQLCYVHWGDFKNPMSAMSYLFGDQRVDLEDFLISGDPSAGRDTLASRMGQDSVEALQAHSSLSVLPAPQAAPDDLKALELPGFASLVDNRHGMMSFSDLNGHLALEASSSPLPEDSAPPADDDPFFGFPRGEVAGSCVHEFFELFDLSLFKDDPARAREEGLAVAAKSVDSYGLAGRRDAPGFESRLQGLSSVVLGMAERVASASLPSGAGAPFRLMDVPRGLTLREMEFDYPVLGRFDIELLNKLLLDYGFEGLRHELPEAFEELQARLPSLPLEPGGSLRQSVSLKAMSRRSGIMNGKIDLILEHGGRYHLVDWKSNWLGASFESYSAPKVMESVFASGYVLQCHIYALALHRHLQSTLGADYDYDAHFGEVLYLYVRGVKGSEGTGIFRDRPSLRLLEELSRLILDGGRR